MKDSGSFVIIFLGFCVLMTVLALINKCAPDPEIIIKEVPVKKEATVKKESPVKTNGD